MNIGDVTISILSLVLYMLEIKNKLEMKILCEAKIKKHFFNTVYDFCDFVLTH